MEIKDYSQKGEQQKLINIFNEINTTNKICIEFGADDGYNLSNTRYFIEQGWKGYQWDAVLKSNLVNKEFITIENINNIFGKYKIPKSFDLLSIDIDGMDYWVWKALTEFTPRVIIIEFNPSKKHNENVTIKYDPNFKFDQTDYYGASFMALFKLGHSKGYELVDYTELNMMFVNRNCITSNVMLSIVEKGISYKVKKGWKPDKKNREWIKV